MLNRTTSTRFFAPRRPRIKIRIPKLEIRNKPKHSNPKIEIQNETVWRFPFFNHLDLFRISKFEFRICNSICTWRALRLRASDLFPDSGIQNSTENFKYLCLGFRSASPWGPASANLGTRGFCHIAGLSVAAILAVPEDPY